MALAAASLVRCIKSSPLISGTPATQRKIVNEHKIMGKWDVEQNLN